MSPEFFIGLFIGAGAAIILIGTRLPERAAAVYWRRRYDRLQKDMRARGWLHEMSLEDRTITARNTSGKARVRPVTFVRRQSR